MQKRVRYPLGIQTFEKLRKGGYLYVDKTEYVYEMTHSDSSCIFLSRPRRFGKSLLVSTLKAYFEGKKELFEGLAIEKLETEWESHPVLHFSLATAKHKTREKLESNLHFLLLQYEEIYGKGEGEEEPSQRLFGLIKRAYRQTGKPVVLLIDEYDAPLLDVMHDEDSLLELRETMQNFYSPIKDCDEYLRFFFITGVTKYSQLSIFSELNNLLNISMLRKYAGVCGISEKDMLKQMDEGINALAEEEGWTKEETINELKSNYDGYHFSWPSEDIYNPYSLLNAMATNSIDSYWFGSGTPSYLIALFNKFGVTPAALGGVMTARKDDFDKPTQNMSDIAPLLYQSGYLTIKDYDNISKVYTLGIPNNEIRVGLFHNLLPNYVGSYARDANTTAALMQVAMQKDDIEEMLRLLKTFLGTIPSADYVNKPENYEAHWQQLFYTIFSLLGARVDVEIRIPRGRVDMVARTSHKLYLFEFKLNKSADAALEQINLKDYAARFALCGLPTVKVGVNFDADQRNITDWVTE